MLFFDEVKFTGVNLFFSNFTCRKKNIFRVSVYSISLTGEIKSNFSWRVEILTSPFPPKNVIFTPFSHVFPRHFDRFAIRNYPLASTGKSLNFDVKIVHFAENRISIFPLHRENLVSEIPARLILYTDTLKTKINFLTSCSITYEELSLFSPS